MTPYIQVILFGRVPNGCSHDFKFTKTCSNFRTILYMFTLQNLCRMTKAKKPVVPGVALSFGNVMKKLNCKISRLILDTSM